jgi:uncharacterized membrane protein
MVKTLRAEPGQAIQRRRFGLAMAISAAIGIGISAYLAAVKLAGGQPYCGPLVGCETVNNSVYSEFLGIPVALFGLSASAVVLLGVLAWWHLHLRLGLLVAYAIGLASLPALAYLTYLELFVIHAICVWCVAYAVSVIAGCLIAAWALFRGPAATS